MRNTQIDTTDPENNPLNPGLMTLNNGVKRMKKAHYKKRT